MESIQPILLAVHIFCGLFIVILGLLQPSTGDGSLVSNNASPSSIVSGKTVTSFLQKFTFLIMAVFMVNVLLLGIIAHKKSDKGSKLEQAIERKLNNENQQIPQGE